MVAGKMLSLDGVFPRVALLAAAVSTAGTTERRLAHGNADFGALSCSLFTYVQTDCTFLGCILVVLT